MAEQIKGSKANLFDLEKRLVRKVLAGLKVSPKKAEEHALDDPGTRDFEAFRLYGEGRQAQADGCRQDAEQRLREALARDPHFRLAMRELNKLEDEVLLRISEEGMQQAAAAGKAGAALESNREMHLQTVQADRRDAAYFASMLVLAAHAGLSGQPVNERKLLIAYWQRFCDAIPPDECFGVAEQIKSMLIREGRFFEETLDSGAYGLWSMKVGAKKDDVEYLQLYLKPELRGVYRWPHYSSFWPFNKKLRKIVAQVDRNRLEFGEGWFDGLLPKYPHDYIRFLLEPK